MISFITSLVMLKHSAVRLCVLCYWVNTDRFRHPQTYHATGPEGMRPLGRPRRRWEDNIKMDLKKVSCEGVHWIDLAQDRDRWRKLVNAVMNFRVP